MYILKFSVSFFVFLFLIEYDSCINSHCVDVNWMSYLENGAKHIRSYLSRCRYWWSPYLAGLFFNGIAYLTCVEFECQFPDLFVLVDKLLLTEEQWKYNQWCIKNTLTFINLFKSLSSLSEQRRINWGQKPDKCNDAFMCVNLNASIELHLTSKARNCFYAKIIIVSFIHGSRKQVGIFLFWAYTSLIYINKMRNTSIQNGMYLGGSLYNDF